MNVYVNLSIYNENDQTINLICKQLNDLIEHFMLKYPINENIKNRISTFLIKNKKNKLIKIKTYEVVDFDDFLEFIIGIFREVESKILFNL